MTVRETPTSVTVTYDRARALKQVGWLTGATVVLAGFAALGVWVGLASFDQSGARDPQRWIGLAVGVLFVVVALPAALTGAAALARAVRAAAGHAEPLLVADLDGATIGGRRVPWAQITGIRVQHTARRERRYAGGAEARLGRAVSNQVARRGARSGFGDGTRMLTFQGPELGMRGLVNLTGPIGDDDFALMVTRLEAIAHRVGVPVTG